MGQEGRSCTQPLAQAGRCAQGRRSAASDSVPGARFFEFDSLLIRSQRSRQGRVLAHERVRALRLRRLDHGPRRLRILGQFGEQFRYRQQRRGSQSRDPSGSARNRASEDAFLRDLLRRHPRRRFRASRAGAGRPAGAGRLHLQRHWRAGDRQAGATDRVLPQPQSAQARCRDDPLDLRP